MIGRKPAEDAGALALVQLQAAVEMCRKAGLTIEDANSTSGLAIVVHGARLSATRDGKHAVYQRAGGGVPA